jgi:hypothetical protein
MYLNIYIYVYEFIYLLRDGVFGQDDGRGPRRILGQSDYQLVGDHLLQIPIYMFIYTYLYICTNTCIHMCVYLYM